MCDNRTFFIALSGRTELRGIHCYTPFTERRAADAKLFSDAIAVLSIASVM
jgi:hypothetical protein